MFNWWRTNGWIWMIFWFLWISFSTVFQLTESHSTLCWDECCVYFVLNVYGSKFIFLHIHSSSVKLSDLSLCKISDFQDVWKCICCISDYLKIWFTTSLHYQANPFRFELLIENLLFLQYSLGKVVMMKLHSFSFDNRKLYISICYIICVLVLLQ